MTAARYILFVDDELIPGQTQPNGNYMWYYVLALREAGFELTVFNATDETFRALALSTTKFDLIIQDAMMVPGNALAHEDTQEGTRTGYVMAKRLRRLFAESNPDVPIIIFSQRQPKNLEEFDTIKNCCVRLKDDYTPDQLVAKAEAVIAAGEATAEPQPPP